MPRWRKGSGLGWVTAEYSMLPRATLTRNDRESVRGKIGGRTHEISRLIGRSLRAAIDLSALGENSIAIDCDVLQADGGTRTAAITGAYVALADAVGWLGERGSLAKQNPLINAVSAVSVGVIDGEARLDLMYTEDVRAETDMNVVLTGNGDFVEVQGTAEGVPFRRDELDALLDLAVKGCAELNRHQHAALAGPVGAADRRGAHGMTTQLMLATRNAKKLAELRRIVAPQVEVEVLGLDDVPASTRCPNPEPPSSTTP